MKARATKTESPTKQRLLDAAERLMLAKGFAATTVDEICAAAKLTKGSFFHYFASKDELGRDLLERFCGSMQQRFQTCCPQERDPLRRVYAHVEAAIVVSKACRDPEGCLVGTFAQELSDTHPKIRQMCAQMFDAWAQRFKRDLDEAKARYTPRARFDTASLADHYVAIVEGANILAKARKDGRVMEQSLRHFEEYLRTLFGR